MGKTGSKFQGHPGILCDNASVTAVALEGCEKNSARVCKTCSLSTVNNKAYVHVMEFSYLLL